MASLNQLADGLALRLNKPHDAVLKELIKDEYKSLRALYLRRTIGNHGINSILSQSYDIELIPIDFTDSCFISGDCIIMRTKNKVAQPLRYETDIPFMYVGTLDGISFLHSTFATAKNYKYLPYIGKTMTYFYENNYIYLLNNNKIKYIRVQAVFSSPDQVISLCNSDCYSDDMEFPLPLDIISSITNDIYNIFINKQNEEVQLNENRNRPVQATSRGTREDNE